MSNTGLQPLPDQHRGVCPQCKKDVVFVRVREPVAGPIGDRCPECGYTTQRSRYERISRKAWAIFFAVLLAPALVSFLLQLTGNHGEYGNTGPLADFALHVAIFGSGAAALFCGFWCSRRMHKDILFQILDGLGLSILFYGASFACCIVGCSAAQGIK